MSAGKVNTSMKFQCLRDFSLAGRFHVAEEIALYLSQSQPLANNLLKKFFADPTAVAVHRSEINDGLSPVGH